MTLDQRTIEVIEKCLANQVSCEVKVEKGQFVVIELGRKLKSKVPIDELNIRDCAKQGAGTANKG